MRCVILRYFITIAFFLLCSILFTDLRSAFRCRYFFFLFLVFTIGQRHLTVWWRLLLILVLRFFHYIRICITVRFTCLVEGGVQILTVCVDFGVRVSRHRELISRALLPILSIHHLLILFFTYGGFLNLRPSILDLSRSRLHIWLLLIWLFHLAVTTLLFLCRFLRQLISSSRCLLVSRLLLLLRRRCVIILYTGFWERSVDAVLGWVALLLRLGETLCLLRLLFASLLVEGSGQVDGSSLVSILVSSKTLSLHVVKVVVDGIGSVCIEVISVKLLRFDVLLSFFLTLLFVFGLFTAFRVVLMMMTFAVLLLLAIGPMQALVRWWAAEVRDN